MGDEVKYDNTGILFINKFKKTDKHPALRGTATVAGQQYDCAAWNRLTHKGDKMLTLKFSPPYDRDAQKRAPYPGPAPAQEASPPVGDDDSIPITESNQNMFQ